MLVTCNGCKDKPVNEWQTRYDSLVNVIEKQKKEIEKQDEIIKYYAQAYDSTAEINDSLQHVGVKVITRYREVKVLADTSELLAICDSLANEYEAFIDQTKVTIAAADSVMSAQSSQIENLKGNNATLQELVKTLKDKIEQQEREIDKWRKLAKRRARAIEW
jgi:peptidoglycan hydrolase CwlO-like protein